MKQILVKYLPLNYFQKYTSYSQEGEDMVLRSFYEGKKNYKGFFVDVGAHHPYRFSNTLFFYKQGWRGINIEPTPGSIKAFKLFRKKDINLNIGISPTKGELTFYCFNEPALNGFSKELSQERDKENSKYRITQELPILTMPLADVFDQYLPVGQAIDFLTIDVEGLDLAVLQSNNWGKYKPAYIAVEDRVDLENLKDSAIYEYLKEQGYSFIAKTLRTLFFKKM
ncbi:FkbM family methyltransferase [Mucilaginibacter achroorhodeus]|uniref:FkbM family methyltransferase n=1 Tax=Mucilaginibacter achroorhodeus TaxID=2599294 RepID=UPI001C9692CF|nr:FkbM family methyltransferase [Mucilaginibacter achroorhodeus]